MKKFFILFVLFFVGCLSQQPEAKIPEERELPEAEPLKVFHCRNSPFGFHTGRTFPTSLEGKPRAEIDKRDYINFYEDAQYIGVAWERPGLYCHWIIIQPTKEDIDNSIFHWELNDDVYKGIPENICILGNIGLPERVLPNSWTLTESEENYTKFVKAVVERYDGDGINDMPGLHNPVVYWQVENEPDPHGDWQGYSHIQTITYNAIKDACPECCVLMGGMTGGGIPTFETFYRPILNQLQGECIDVFDFHWYGNAFGDYKKGKPVYEVIRKGLDEAGFTETEIWITEMGTYSGSPFKWKEQTEEDQARDLVKRYVYPLSFGVKKVFWAWGLMEGFKHNNGFFDHTGFIYDGEYPDDLGRGKKKLSYYTYKKMTEVLEGCHWESIKTISEKDLYIFEVLKDGKLLYVIWQDDFHLSSEKEVSLHVGSDNKFIVTEAVPHFQQGINVDNYETAFTVYLLEPEDKTLRLVVGNTPVYLEEVFDSSSETYLSWWFNLAIFAGLAAIFKNIKGFQNRF